MQQSLVKFESSELSSIEPSKALKIKATFEPMAEMLADFESAYGEIVVESEKEITKELTGKAKRLRLDIGKVRIETEKLRKTKKEEYLRAGKAIDGVSNILKWAVTDKENRLKEIEDHFEVMERNRLEALQKERASALYAYVDDAYDRNLSGMDADVWVAYLSTKKKEHEDQIEAERKAEQERIAREKSEAEENERIRKENERLKKEAEAERIAREEKERKEREAHEAELRKIREENERIRQAETAEREAHEAEKAKLEYELKRQVSERRKIEQDRIEKEKAEAQAKAEAAKKAADKTHQAKVNREIVAALVEDGIEEHIARQVVVLVAKGKVPHIAIGY